MTDREMHQNILIGALEGGTGYWAQVHAYSYTKLVADIELLDTGERFHIDEQVIAKGLKKVASGGVANANITGIAHMATYDPERASVNMDAEVVDCIVQAGLFDEIVFG